MKRFLCIILSVLFVCQCMFAYGELGDFTIRNGIHRQMDYKEILEIEKQLGNEKPYSADEDKVYFTDISVAGISDSQITYRLQNGKIAHIHYLFGDFNSSSYDTLAKQLTTNYGSCIYSGSYKKGYYEPYQGKELVTFQNLDYAGGLKNILIDPALWSASAYYKEWIVPFSDCYAVITLCECSPRGRTDLEIFYSLYEPEVFEKMIDDYNEKVNQENQALMELQKRREQELANDL